MVALGNAVFEPKLSWGVTTDEATENKNFKLNSFDHINIYIIGNWQEQVSKI